MSDQSPREGRPTDETVPPRVSEPAQPGAENVEPAASVDPILVTPIFADGVSDVPPHDSAPELVEPVRAEPVRPLSSFAPQETGEVVEPVVVEPVAVEPVAVVAEPAPIPAPAEPAGSRMPQQTVYVSEPVPPAKKGNRGVGILLAIVATIVFTALYALVVAIIEYYRNGDFSFDFLTAFDFYVPSIFFLIGFVLLVLLANRAGWWAYILGSLFVALFVYAGTVATGLVIGGVVVQTQTGAALLLGKALANPLVIAATLLAREVALWSGAAIAARGRRVKRRNAEARADFDRETAENDATIEKARYSTGEVAV